MNKLRLLVLSLLVSGFLSGCVIVAGDHDFDGDEELKQQQNNNLQMINNLVLQTARADVVVKMGKPNFTEAFIKGNDEYRVLSYRTHHRHSDSKTSKDETTPVIFKNDKLVGWG